MWKRWNVRKTLMNGWSDSWVRSESVQSERGDKSTPGVDLMNRLIWKVRRARWYFTRMNIRMNHSGSQNIYFQEAAGLEASPPRNLGSSRRMRYTFSCGAATYFDALTAEILQGGSSTQTRGDSGS